MNQYKIWKSVKYFCNIIIPFEDTQILELIQHQKSDKPPFIIYADLKSIIERIDGHKIILKVHLQQKSVTIFHKVFEWLQYIHLEK